MLEVFVHTYDYFQKVLIPIFPYTHHTMQRYIRKQNRKRNKKKLETISFHSAGGKFTHSEKSMPPALCICICCSTGNRLPPNPGSLKSCPGNGIMLGCSCGSMCSCCCWCCGLSWSPSVGIPCGIGCVGGPRSRLMTSRQRVAKRLVPSEGWVRRDFVVSMSWSQEAASGFEGSVIKKTMGMSPAWKRK